MNVTEGIMTGCDNLEDVDGVLDNVTDCSLTSDLSHNNQRKIH